MNIDLKDVVVIAISVFISLLFLVGNNWLLSINQPRYAVIDVQQIYEENQKDFVTNLLSKKNLTDDDRINALSQAQTFGKQLDEILRTLPKECGCIILSKSAVVTSATLKDYTQEVKARLAEKK